MSCVAMEKQAPSSTSGGDAAIIDRLAANPASATAAVSGSTASIKHALQNRWTFWYQQPQRGGSKDWNQNLVQIVDIDTV